MGIIATSTTVTNSLSPEKKITFDAVIDTGASHLTLPTVWKEKLGDLEHLEYREVMLADQRTIKGELCGPVKVHIEGFRPVVTEVLFVDMEPREGRYEPLIGYLVLEAIPVAVDMLGHRLVQVRYLDLK